MAVRGCPDLGTGTSVKQPKPSPRSIKLQANRKVAVFVSLVAMVALTSLLLVALAPPPLTSSAWQSLFAVDAPQTLDAVFDTDAGVTPGRWRYIYVHHSRTAGGDAVSLSQPPGDGPAFEDHFVIGNGDGANDGEVQMTQLWNHQEAVRTPPPGARLSSACVSICVVGDFSHTRPTPAQQRRLSQLVEALQARLHVPAAAVFAHPEVDTAAGVGHAFPVGPFREQLLP